MNYIIISDKSYFVISTFNLLIRMSINIPITIHNIPTFPFPIVVLVILLYTLIQMAKPELNSKHHTEHNVATCFHYFVFVQLFFISIHFN